MRVFKTAISLGVFTSLAAPALANWTWVSEELLVTQGISQYADRLEIMRSDDCNGLRVRAWAKIGDKAGNTLKRGDSFELDVRLGDVKFLDRTKVLGIARDFDEDFDVIYLDFGEWHWGIADVLSDNSNQSLTATFLSKNANIEDNVWLLDGFSEQVVRLRDECTLEHQGVVV